MKKRKNYTAKQKAQIFLELLKEEKSVAHISSEYGIHPNQLIDGKSKGWSSSTKSLRIIHNFTINQTPDSVNLKKFLL